MSNCVLCTSDFYVSLCCVCVKNRKKKYQIAQYIGTLLYQHTIKYNIFWKYLIIYTSRALTIFKSNCSNPPVYHHTINTVRHVNVHTWHTFSQLAYPRTPLYTVLKNLSEN